MQTFNSFQDLHARSEASQSTNSVFNLPDSENGQIVNNGAGVSGDTPTGRMPLPTFNSFDELAGVESEKTPHSTIVWNGMSSQAAGLLVKEMVDFAEAIVNDPDDIDYNLEALDSIQLIAKELKRNGETPESVLVSIAQQATPRAANYLRSTFYRKHTLSNAQTENYDPVRYAQSRFDELKSFVRRQPNDWRKTGNDVVDSIRKVRFELRGTANKYADSIKIAIRDAARMYEMGSRMDVTIRYPQTSTERIDADQQRRIAELHREFEDFTRKHNL